MRTPLTILMFWTKIHVNILPLGTWSLVLNQHSTLCNKKRFAFESAIKLFLFLERPRKKIIMNKFGDGTHLT
jgi:hypothetical protein